MNKEDLVAAIVADGKVDAEEIAQLREELYADGVIDRAEADMLFEINDACSDNPGNDPEWPEFFAEAIASHVLKDEETPGVVDQTEGDYLASKIEGDGGIDSAEQALLVNLKENATEIQSERLNKLVAIVEAHSA